MRAHLGWRREGGRGEGEEVEYRSPSRIVWYRIVSCVTYFIGPIAIGLHATVRLSHSLYLFPSLRYRVTVVIKYISSTDKCKMDDPPQLQRSWRLRYGKSAGHATGCHRATSIFSCCAKMPNRDRESGARTDSGGIYNSFAQSERDARHVCISGAFW